MNISIGESFTWAKNGYAFFFFFFRENFIYKMYVVETQAANADGKAISMLKYLHHSLYTEFQIQIDFFVV